MASPILFTFDGDAAGLLEAINLALEGLQQLADAASAITSSFVNVNSQAEQISSAWGSLFQNFGQAAQSISDTGSASSSASRAASDLAYQLQQLSTRAKDAAENHADAVDKIREQEQQLTTDTQKEIDRRSQSYAESLQQLVESHQETVDQITEQEQQLGQNYYDVMNKSLLKLNDPMALQHQQIVTSFEQQIAALYSMGNVNQANALTAQLNNENTKYQQFLDTKIKPYFQNIDQAAYQHQQTQLDQLNDRLNKENQKYDEQTTKLKQTYQQQMSDLNEHYRHEEDSLTEHLTTENRKYAEQVAQINAERAHILENAAISGGGGGGGSGSASGSNFYDKNIALFQQFGIDMKKQPELAAQLLQDWIMGGTFQGKKISGVDFTSQMTLQQVQSLVSQALSYSIDPTRQRAGNENYVNLFSDLMAMATAREPTRPAATRFNEMQLLMQHVMEGNMNQIMRLFGTAGITQQELEKVGVKFKGGQIQNPDQLFPDLMTLIAKTDGGLGQKQATQTFAGVMNNIKDLWYQTAQEIGDPANPKGPWARFVGVLHQLFAFLQSHQGDIIGFGKTLFTDVINVIQNFVNFLESKQGQNLIKQIASALHDVGMALSFISQHAGMFSLLGGLLTAGSILNKRTGGGLFGPGDDEKSPGLINRFFTGKAAIDEIPAVLGLSPLAKAREDAMKASGLFMGATDLRGDIAQKDLPAFDIWHGKLRDDMRVKNYLAMSLERTPGADIAPILKEGVPGIDAEASPFSRTMSGLGTAGKNLVRGSQNVSGNVGSFFRSILPFGKGAAGAAEAVAPEAAGALEIGGGEAAAVGGGGLFASVGPALAGIGAAIGPLAAAAGPIGLLALAVGGLIAAIVMNRDKIMPLIHTLEDFFNNKLKQALKALQEFTKGVQERFAAIFAPGSPVMILLTPFIKFWEGTWNGVKMIFTGVWNTVEGVIKIAWSLIQGIIFIGLDLLSGKWSKAWDDLKNMLSGVWNGIKQTISGAFQAVLGVIIGFFGGLWNMIKGPVMIAIGFITGAFSGIVSFVTGLFDPKNMLKALTNFFLWVGGLGLMIAKAIVDHLPGFIQGPVKAALGAIGFQGLALGGYYPGGEVYLVGERGPELFFSKQYGAVVSNSQIRAAFANGGDASSGPSGRIMNFSGDIYITTSDPKDFYRKLNTYAGQKAEFGLRAGALA